jgi:hypothetical protein
MASVLKGAPVPVTSHMYMKSISCVLDITVIDKVVSDKCNLLKPPMIFPIEMSVVRRFDAMAWAQHVIDFAHKHWQHLGYRTWSGNPGNSGGVWPVCSLNSFAIDLMSALVHDGFTASKESADKGWALTEVVV